MDGATTGLIGLVIINISAVAYSYGRLSQKVNDLCHRQDRMEKKFDNLDPKAREL